MDIRITHIAPNGAPYKTNFPFATTWVAPVLYTLEDGRTIEGKLSPFTRKKDAVEDATEREMTNVVANFDETGRFIGTTTTYSLR